MYDKADKKEKLFRIAENFSFFGAPGGTRVYDCFYYYYCFFS